MQDGTLAEGLHTKMLVSLNHFVPTDLASFRRLPRRRSEVPMVTFALPRRSNRQMMSSSEVG